MMKALLYGRLASHMAPAMYDTYGVFEASRTLFAY